MESIWNRFNAITTAEEVKVAMTQNTPIEIGEYECTLVSIEAALSKAQLPMIKGVFRTSEGKNIWYNQSLQNLNYPSLTAANIAAAVQFLSALVGTEYEYKDLDSLADFIATIPCDTTHRIKVSFSTKDVEHRFPILTVIAPDVEYPFTV